jgi:hypothetical protein
MASESDLQPVAEHVARLADQASTAQRDLRAPFRSIERELLSRHAGELIGNQLVDFGKQDGVTEMVEAVQANEIERRLNDLLLQAEAHQQISIRRKPIIVSCVSNFTNFLDLSRKTLRSLELGIPCLVLSRSGTTACQHPFRWSQLLLELMLKEQHRDDRIDLGLLTFVSASLPDLQKLLHMCSSDLGNLYATCSRSTALRLNEFHPPLRSSSSSTNDGDDGEGDEPRVVASTGGPNTLIVLDADGLESRGVLEAIRTSAAIESSGQCTALRHCVIPPAKKGGVDEKDPSSSSSFASLMSKLWDGTQALPLDRPEAALERSVFDGVFVGHTGSLAPTASNDGDGKPSYVHHPPSSSSASKASGDAIDVWYRVSDSLPNGSSYTSSSPSFVTVSAESTLDEYWRKVVVDFTRLDCTTHHGKQQLSDWLNTHQPISLAVNGPRDLAMKVGLELFRTTSLVVYTIGSHDDPKMPPALTCQARPQEGEIFGEFPPRDALRKHTRHPVYIPSPNPSHDASYTRDYLLAVGQPEDQPPQTDLARWNASTRSLLQRVSDPLVRGYCVLLIRYLQNACRVNPKPGIPARAVASDDDAGASRTTLWGLQRPPVGWKTVLTVSDDQAQSSTIGWDDVAPAYLMFHVTNAQSQIELSLSPECRSSNTDLVELCQEHGIPHVVEDDGQRRQRLEAAAATSHNRVFHVAQVPSPRHRDSSSRCFPMVDRFASLYFPLGHIKSTRSQDDEFMLRARLSDKWLQTNF